MHIRTRKLIGTVLLLILVTVYFALATVVTAASLPGRPLALQILGYAIAGMLWVLPAGWLIRWMGRPDA